jgi:hypothetical protein
MHDFEMNEFSVSLVGVVQVFASTWRVFARWHCMALQHEKIFRFDIAQAITSSLTSLKVNID